MHTNFGAMTITRIPLYSFMPFELVVDIFTLYDISYTIVT